MSKQNKNPSLFTASVWREGRLYIAQCREIEIASQGRSKQEAISNLSEAIELHFTPPVATLVPEIYQLEVANAA
jgi:predicted RNase H-like HicB family nuclease